MRSQASVPGELERQIPRMDFLEFLLSGPAVEDFEIERDKDTGREIDLGE
jgi:hypothetical protein